MKVKVEDVIDEFRSSLKKQKPHKKNVEIPLSPLWESPPKEFTEEDRIPPDKWDFQIKKVKL